MLSLIIRLCLIYLVLNHMFSPCDGLRGYGSKSYSSKESSGYRDPAKAKSFAGTTSGIPSQTATRRGLGLSAWGIVTVIVTGILAGMGVYYFTICYPIMCKKTRKYDMIGLPSVV